MDIFYYKRKVQELKIKVISQSGNNSSFSPVSGLAFCTL